MCCVSLSAARKCLSRESMFVWMIVLAALASEFKIVGSCELRFAVSILLNNIDFVTLFI